MTLSKSNINAVADLKPGYTLSAADVALLQEMARRLLAVEGKEPVAYMYRDKLHADARFSLEPRFGNWSPEDIAEYEITETKLYTAPQPAPMAQPVQVPPEQYQHLSELYHAQEKRLFKIAQRIKGPSFDKYAHSPSQAIDVLESAIFGENNDACHAAMINAEPVSQPYKLPQWIPCSERMPELDTRVLLYFASCGGHIEDGCIGDEGDGPYHYFFDGDSLMTEPTHWMPLPAAPQEPTTDNTAQQFESLARRG